MADIDIGQQEDLKVAMQFKVAAVRIPGPIVPGPINGNGGSGGSDYYFPHFIHVSLDGSDISLFPSVHLTISQPTCQIQTKNIDVPMGQDISTSTFTGVGSASTPQEFWLKMQCAAGIPNLQYQFNPAGGSAVVGDPKNGTLSLSNQDGASGLGVQITDWVSGTNPVGLQERRSFGGTYNPDTGGDVSIGWKARYIQTEDHVKGGEADAQATITLSYQ